LQNVNIKAKVRFKLAINKNMAKKVIKKITKKAKSEGKLVGKITHYFSNIEVAVINLSAPLKKGDKIRVVGGQETDFEQEVESMQIDHKEVKSAKKGDSAGMKMDEKVHEGYKVYKV
jgi:putative protease